MIAAAGALGSGRDQRVDARGVDAPGEAGVERGRATAGGVALAARDELLDRQDLALFAERAFGVAEPVFGQVSTRERQVAGPQRCPKMAG